MALLPDSGTCSYNGVTFTSLFHSRMTGVPVPDNAHRAVKYVRYKLHVEGTVQSDSGTGVTLDSMRKLLQQPAGVLSYTNRGFGTFLINSPGNGVNDVCYGPWPTLFSFQPIGGAQACHIIWECDICIPECVNGIAGLFLAFTFDINWLIDQDGYTTVTYSGEAEIPVTRDFAGGVNVPNSADVYWEKIFDAFPLLPDMQPESSERRLSADRRILYFTIKHKEVPFPLAADVTTATANENITAVTNNGACSLQVWTLTLHGQVTLKAGVPKKGMFAFMQLIIASRTDPLKNLGFTIIPRGLSLDDDILGRSGGFSCEFQVIGDLNLNSQNYQSIGSALEIMAKAGELWTPLDKVNFPGWQNSLKQDGPASPRGFLGAKHRPRDDAIIDICKTDTARSITGGRAAPRQGFLPPFPSRPSQPRPSASWLEYFIEAEYEETGGTVQHTPVGKTVIITGTVKVIDATGPGIEKGPTNPTVPKLRQGRDPERTITIRGEAVRVGYRIPPPKLLHIGGTPVTEVSRILQEEVIADVAGIPIWRLRWRLKYVIDLPPQSEVKPQPDAIKLRNPNESRYSR